MLASCLNITKKLLLALRNESVYGKKNLAVYTTQLDDCVYFSLRLQQIAGNFVFYRDCNARGTIFFSHFCTKKTHKNMSIQKQDTRLFQDIFGPFLDTDQMRGMQLVKPDTTVYGSSSNFQNKQDFIKRSQTTQCSIFVCTFYSQYQYICILLCSLSPICTTYSCALPP